MAQRLGRRRLSAAAVVATCCLLSLSSLSLAQPSIGPAPSTGSVTTLSVRKPPPPQAKKPATTPTSQPPLRGSPSPPPPSSPPPAKSPPPPKASPPPKSSSSPPPAVKKDQDMYVGTYSELVAAAKDPSALNIYLYSDIYYPAPTTNDNGGVVIHDGTNVASSPGYDTTVYASGRNYAFEISNGVSVTQLTIQKAKVAAIKVISPQARPAATVIWSELANNAASFEVAGKARLESYYSTVFDTKLFNAKVDGGATAALMGTKWKSGAKYVLDGDVTVCPAASNVQLTNGAQVHC